MRPTPAQAHPATRLFRRAWTLLVVRLAAVSFTILAIWLGLRTTSGITAFPPSTVWATLGLLPVNLLCLWLVRRYYRAEGMGLREALGVRRGRLGRDILWGLLWVCVMNIPFVLAVSGTVFVMYGADTPQAFQMIFHDPAAEIPLEPLPLLVISLLGVLPFMLINAPTEELVFRGFALRGISDRWGAFAGTACTSILFGAQHIFFAASVPGMVVFFVAYVVWGVVAAVIVQRQGRLFPVVIAHWLINVMMSVPGLVFPVLLLTGVV